MEINLQKRTGIVVQNATVNDLDTIYALFEQAIAYQKEKGYIGWKTYDRSFLRSDVENNLLFKITKGNDIICIFSVCYTDPVIWRELEKGDAIYLHRIVLNRSFEGERIFQKVLDWAIAVAKERRLKHVRMDTWAENEKLIAYYRRYGFQFIENYTTSGTEDLPVQHRNLHVALLEFNVHAE